MGKRILQYKHKPVVLKKAVSHPDFKASTVLVSDPWQYVDLWLRREKHHDARFYWQQAEQFALAARTLPPTASPLPAYYCILNATKALLEAKGQVYSPHHGVTGWKIAGQRGLRAESVKMAENGVLPSLVKYLDEWSGPEVFDLYSLLYNLPFIHRAFTVTFSTAKELFIPIRRPRFVVKDGSHECWFEAEVEHGYANGHTTLKLPAGFERDHGATPDFVIRRKKRFEWTFAAKDEPDNVRRLCKYHHATRRSVFYIQGDTRLWYLKRKSDGVADFISHTSLPVTYAAMHRLSELARYEPLTLSKHFDAAHNWLLSEFIGISLNQFIDEIASEMTGRDFMPPGIRR